MALGSGFSYRDWVALSAVSSDITFSTAVANTNILPLANCTTPRPKQISRTTTTTLATHQIVAFTLEMTATTDGNEFDGKVGMTIGCIGAINHNMPLDRDAYVQAILYDDVGGVIHSSSTYSATRQFEDASIYFLLDDVYTEVFKVVLLIGVEGVFSELDLGRLWIGNYLEADFDGNFGLLHGYAAKPKYSIGNDIHLRYKTPRKEMNFDFSLIDTAVVYGAGIDSWMDFSKWTSTNRDLVVLPNVADDDEKQYLGTYGILKRPMKLERLHGSYWSADFDVVELV